MKVRDSGMPGESLWATFFDPPAILARLGFNSPQAVPTAFSDRPIGVALADPHLAPRPAQLGELRWDAAFRTGIRAARFTVERMPAPIELEPAALE